MVYNMEWKKETSQKDDCNSLGLKLGGYGISNENRKK